MVVFKKTVLALLVLCCLGGITMAEELEVDDKDIYSYTFRNPKGEIWSVWDEQFVDGDIIERVVVKHGWIYFQRYDKGKWITSPIMPMEAQK